MNCLTIKRLLSTVVLSVFLLTFVAPSTLAEGSEQEIIAIVNEALEKEHSILPSTLRLHQQIYDASAQKWTLSYLLIDNPGDTDGLYLVEVSAGNTVTLVKEPTLLGIDEQLMSSYQNTPNYTIEAMFDLKKQWEPYLPQLNEILDAQQKEGRRSEFLRMCMNLVESDIQLPSQEHVSIDMARKVCVTTMMDSLAWTQEMVDQYVLFAELFYHSKELNKPVYHLIYKQQSAFSQRYYDAPYAEYEKQYLKPLEQLFRDHGLEAPLYISIRMDAYSGELAQEPYIQYIPLTKLEFETVR
ncbi:MAG: hypothetical protein RSE58_01925 [Clostridia bacterium]